MAREEWAGKQEFFDPAKFIFFGESGINTKLARLRLGKLVIPMGLDGAMDGEHFRAYVEQILVSELTPGDVVVIDKLPTQKVADVRAAIEAAGAHLLYLPSYSPDFKPIEMAFSKFKTHIRAVNPRTLNELCHASCNAGRRFGFPSGRGKSGWTYFGSFLVPRRPRTTIGRR